MPEGGRWSGGADPAQARQLLAEASHRERDETIAHGVDLLRYFQSDRSPEAPAPSTWHALGPTFAVGPRAGRTRPTNSRARRPAPTFLSTATGQEHARPAEGFAPTLSDVATD